MPKADILNLDLASLKQAVAGQTVRLDGVTAKVNTTLANALGLPSADGATLGTAAVTATSASRLPPATTARASG